VLVDEFSKNDVARALQPDTCIDEVPGDAHILKDLKRARAHADRAAVRRGAVMRSIMRGRTPCLAISAAMVNPTGPAPMTNTSFDFLSIISLYLLTIPFAKLMISTAITLVISVGQPEVACKG
jgi:hypothetical protein